MPDVASQAKIASAHAAASQSAARQNRADNPPDSAFSEMLDSAATQPEPKPRASETARRDEPRATDDKSEPASSSKEKSDAAPAKGRDSKDTVKDTEAEPDKTGTKTVQADPTAKPVQETVAVAAAVLPETEVTTEDTAKPEKEANADPASDAAALLIPQVEIPVAKPAELAVAVALPVAAAPSDGKNETPDVVTPAVHAGQPIKTAPVLPVAAQAAPAEESSVPQAGSAKPHFAIETEEKPAAPATVEAHAARAVAAAADAKSAEAPVLQPAAQPSNSVQTAATPAHLNTATQTGTPAAAAAPTAQQAVATPIPLNAVAVEIAARATTGGKRFDIRLDPPELGKIDVRLDIDKHGQVTSRLIVEKAETLDLLRRDAPQLERALQDAGLKTSGDGLQFSLQQHMAQQDDSTGGRLTDSAQLSIIDETIAPDIVQRGYAQMAAARGGVDIRV